MKVSTRVECGILALADIAMHQSEGKPVTVSSISSRQDLSMKYLEQILMVLRQSNLVRSTLQGRLCTDSSGERNLIANGD